MEEMEVYRMVGYLHLVQWGDPRRAAAVIGELAEARAKPRQTAPTVEDVQNVMLKLCDWLPNKPEDYQAFITLVRPLLVAHPDGPKIAAQVFTQEFLNLDLAETVKLFREKVSFFAPGGNVKVVDNSQLPKDWSVQAPFGGLSAL